MVYAVLMMCLSPNLGYDKLMHHLAQAAGGPGSWSPPHKSTFAKARLRLGWEVFERLFRALARPLADPQRDSCCFWRGRRLVAIDGTTIEVALVPEIEKEFGGPVTSGGAAAGLPQARAVALTECGTHALLDIEAGHYDLGEHTLAAPLVRSVQPGMLLLADRYYPSKDLWIECTKAGADLLWRAKSSVAKRVIEVLPDGSYLARFGKGKALTVRVIEYKIKGSKEVYRLLTNLLDPIQAPAHELAALYAERWEIEILFKEVKTAQILGRPLRSKTLLGARQEFWAHCLLHLISRQVAYQAAATTPDRDPDRISFSLALDIIRRSVSWATGLGVRKLKAAVQHAIDALTARRALQERRDRAYPRVLRHRHPRYKSLTTHPAPGETRCPRRPQITVCGA